MSNQPFSIKKTADTNMYVVYTASGAINTNSAPIFEKTLENAVRQADLNEQASICVNMAAVTFLSSMGIRVILASFKKAKARKIEFYLECLPENVRNVIGMVALDQLMVRS